MVDDFGYECVGADGGESYETPNLDKMAEHGMRFTDCYSMPLCTPSRVQIMTGKYNVRNYNTFAKLERDQITFGNLLQSNGYATCIAGKWQLGKESDSAQHFGFDESLLWQQSGGRTRKGTPFDSRYPNPELDTNGNFKRYNEGEFGPDLTLDFVLNFMRKNKERPFFVYYPMILTHCPFSATPDSEEWDPNSLGSKTYFGEKQFFGDMVGYVDKNVGLILGELSKLGLSDNTLVLFTGDNGTDKPIVSMLNGEPYKGGKGDTNAHGTHVPLIAYWPGKIQPGVNGDLIDFSDFLPTLCQAAGVAIPKDLTIDGRSFLPQLLGEKGDPREWSYSWYKDKTRDNKIFAWAMDHRYKLYQSGDFYDLQNDLLEEHPIASKDLDPQARQAKAQLQQVIDHYAAIDKHAK